MLAVFALTKCYTRIHSLFFFRKTCIKAIFHSRYPEAQGLWRPASRPGHWASTRPVGKTTKVKPKQKSSALKLKTKTEVGKRKKKKKPLLWSFMGMVSPNKKQKTSQPLKLNDVSSRVKFMTVPFSNEEQIDRKDVGVLEVGGGSGSEEATRTSGVSGEEETSEEEEGGKSLLAIAMEALRNNVLGTTTSTTPPTTSTTSTSTTTTTTATTSTATSTTTVSTTTSAAVTSPPPTEAKSVSPLTTTRRRIKSIKSHGLNGKFNLRSMRIFTRNNVTELASENNSRTNSFISINILSDE